MPRKVESVSLCQYWLRDVARTASSAEMRRGKCTTRVSSVRAGDSLRRKDYTGIGGLGQRGEGLWGGYAGGGPHGAPHRGDFRAGGRSPNLGTRPLKGEDDFARGARPHYFFVGP